LAFCEIHKTSKPQNEGKYSIFKAGGLNTVLDVVNQSVEMLEQFDPFSTDTSRDQYHEESPYTNLSNLSAAKKTGVSAWLFVSMDSNGKVLVNYINKMKFIYYASKTTLSESRNEYSKF
jgi:hypothetical protein